MSVVLAVLMAITLIPSAYAVSHYEKDMHKWSTEKLYEKGMEFSLHETGADSAIACYTIIDNRYKDDRSEQAVINRTRALNNRGYIQYYGKYDFKKSIVDLMESLELCESLPEKIPTESYVCLNIANIFLMYSEMKDTPKYKERAVGYLTRSIDTAIALQEWEILMRSFITLTALDIETGALGNAMENVRKFRRSNPPKGIMLAEYCRHRCNAIEAMAKGDMKTAESELKAQLLHIDTDVTPERYRLQVYGDLLSLYTTTGDRDSVNHYMEIVKHATEKSGEEDLRALSIKGIFNLNKYEGPQRMDSSLQHQFLKQTEYILHDRELDDISEAYLEKEMEKAKDRESKYDSEVKKSHKVTLTISVILFSAILVIMGLTIYNRRLTKRNRQLYADARKRAEEDVCIYGGKSGFADSTGCEVIEVIASTVTDSDEDAESGSEAVKDTEYNGKYSSSALDEKFLRELMEKINEVVHSSEEIFDSAFSIARLAELIGSKPRYVSQAISMVDGRNFNAVVNECRVREACRRFDNRDVYGNMTVESIGQSVGFRSRTSFSEAFKRNTGLTPSAYARQAAGSSRR